MAALRETLDDVCEPGDCAPQPHTRAQLHRRIEELKVRGLLIDNPKILHFQNVSYGYKKIKTMDMSKPKSMKPSKNNSSSCDIFAI